MPLEFIAPGQRARLDRPGGPPVEIKSYPERATGYVQVLRLTGLGITFQTTAARLHRY